MFYAPKFGHTILVLRVARDGSWADVEVHEMAPSVASWHKRQPLRDGKFAFEVEEVTPA